MSCFDADGLPGGLQERAASDLDRRGFSVLPGFVRPDRVESLAAAYDRAVQSATGADIGVGRSSTRVTDFVNRGPEFDHLYVHPSLLEAARLVVGQPFKLSSFQARSLHPHAPAGEFHVDVRRDSADWPLLGFILMVDGFRHDNGATRFVPTSHRWQDAPEDALNDRTAEYEGEELAIGDAGSMLIFHGSTWHGSTANRTARERRSLQGAFIPRGGRSGTDFGVRMTLETRARLGSVVRDVLGLE
jgi:ectoine hydroxylase-related dioxygenase (phytanoyl-CoA dioxygenase family)